MKYTLGDTLLKLQDVSLSFGTTKVLRDINLEIKDIKREDSITGQIWTLLGRSGVGKTQLMKIIAGLQTPSSGQVLIGKDQRDVQPGQVGMVLQDYPLFTHRTVMKNMFNEINEQLKLKGLSTISW